MLTSLTFAVMLIISSQIFTEFMNVGHVYCLEPASFQISGIWISDDSEGLSRLRSVSEDSRVYYGATVVKYGNYPGDITLFWYIDSKTVGRHDYNAPGGISKGGGPWALNFSILGPPLRNGKHEYDFKILGGPTDAMFFDVIPRKTVNETVDFQTSQITTTSSTIQEASISQSFFDEFSTFPAVVISMAVGVAIGMGFAVLLVQHLRKTRHETEMTSRLKSCPKCQKSLPEDAEFCSECGEEIV